MLIKMEKDGLEVFFYQKYFHTFMERKWDNVSKTVSN